MVVVPRSMATAWRLRNDNGALHPLRDMADLHGKQGTLLPGAEKLLRTVRREGDQQPPCGLGIEEREQTVHLRRHRYLTNVVVPVAVAAGRHHAVPHQVRHA